ncbi:RNase P protein component 2 family protein [Abortiporus biennis]
MVRFKNRWILVEFIPCVSPTNSNNSSILAAPVLNSPNNEITRWGAVGSSLNIKYYSPTTNVCIIRVARDPYRIAWAGVTFLTSIDGKGYLPNVVHVSGTIKQAQMAAIQHNREVIARYRVLARTPAAYQDSYETFLKTSTEEIEALQD